MSNGVGQHLGIVHVPKSGGTAVRNALSGLPTVYDGPLYFDRAHFGTARLVDGVPRPNADKVASVAELAVVVETHRAVVGHYSAPTLLEAGCTALAVQLREPRSRILSLYRFWEGQSDEERSSWGLWGQELVALADLPLREFLRSAAVWPATDNAMYRQLFGGHGARGTWSRRFFTRRRRSLGAGSPCGAIAVAEWADQSEAFVARVCAVISTDEVPSLARDNVTEVRGESQVIDRQTLDLLDQLTRGDSSLLAQLMRDGVLAPRSPAELDEEFRDTARRLSFRVAG